MGLGQGREEMEQRKNVKEKRTLRKTVGQKEMEQRKNVKEKRT